MNFDTPVQSNHERALAALIQAQTFREAEKQKKEELLNNRRCYSCNISRCHSTCDICDRVSCQDHCIGENGDYDCYGPCYCLPCNVEIEKLREKQKSLLQKN